MAIQDHDWFTVIIAEILLWTVIYWQRGGRWKLLVEAINGTATIGGGSKVPSSTPNPASGVVSGVSPGTPPGDTGSGPPSSTPNPSSGVVSGVSPGSA